jgi:hypothetical protein
LAASGIVAALTMFLAREPLMDLAGKLVGRLGAKRKSRKARRTKAAQEPSGE